MAVEFPETEIPVGFDGPVFIDNGRAFVSPLTQSMQFAGSATQLHQATLTTRPMDTDAMRVLKAITDKALREEIIIPVFERYKDALSGSETVTSASGFNLSIANIASGTILKAGQPISISTGGRWYLYTLAADSAAGSTTRSLTLTSSIRAVHASGNSVAVNRAYMQGRAETVWVSDVAGCYHQLTLTVRELR
jgi:hypothetical protein